MEGISSRASAVVNRYFKILKGKALFILKFRIALSFPSESCKVISHLCSFLLSSQILCIYNIHVPYM